MHNICIWKEQNMRIDFPTIGMCWENSTIPDTVIKVMCVTY